MDKIEEIEKVIEGTKANIQLQKAENQKLRNSLNELSMSKAKSMHEVQRLKDVNINLENSIKETKQVIQEQDSKENFDNFIDKLSQELF